VAGSNGSEVERTHLLTSPHRRDGLLSPCLGERRRLNMPRAVMEAARATQLLPDILIKDSNLMDVEVVGINKMTFSTYVSGLLLSVLEPIDAEYCNQTVEEGDTLSVDYEGSLEDGTVFDSSAARNAPFGPFVHGRGQIIQGYTEVLTGRCLGERWRMVVPPHLAYGDSGVGKDIPPKATLTFDVRLVQHNQMKWNDEVKTRKVFGFEEVHTPTKCEEITKKDELYIHYEATRYRFHRPTSIHSPTSGRTAASLARCRTSPLRTARPAWWQRA
jgi:FK506-binding protein 2